MNSKSKKLFNNTVLFLIGNIGSKFIQFILVPLYTYTLTTAQYGVTELIFTTVNFLIPIFSIQVSDGFLRFGLDKKKNKDDVTKMALTVIFFGSLASILFIPVFNISSILSKWLFFFLVILNLRMYRDIFAIRLKILEYNKLYALDSIIYTLVLCISSVIFLVPLRMGIYGYFLSYIVANICSIIFILITSKFSIKILKRKNNTRMLKELILYSLPMIVNSISWWITNASDRYMIEWFMTNSDIGLYSVATKLPTIITSFTGVFNQAWLISSVIEYENEKEKKFYSETFRKFYGLSFLACCFFIMIVKPFMAIYVSNEYYVAWKYAPILIASAISSGIASFMVGIYYACMKNISITITTVIGGIFNIILNLILIPKIGVLGAAIATYISWTIIAFIRMIDIKRIFYFKVNYSRLIFYYILNILEIIAITFFNDIFGYIIAMIITIIMIYSERNLLINIIRNVTKKILSNKT